MDGLGLVGADAFKIFFEKCPEAIALTRLSDDVILEVNQEWTKLTGHAREDVVGRTALDIGHWPDAAMRRDAFQGIKTHGRVSDVDVTLIMAGQLPRLVRINAVLVDVAAGPCILLYLRDVTAERLAQEALRASELALEQVNERLNRQAKLHELTETVAKVGYWVYYPGAGEVQLSAGYCEIGGIDGSNALAPLGVRNIRMPATPAKIWEAVQKARALA